MKADIREYCVLWHEGGFYTNKAKHLGTRLINFMKSGHFPIESYDSNVIVAAFEVPNNPEFDSSDELTFHWCLVPEPCHRLLEFMSEDGAKAAHHYYE